MLCSLRFSSLLLLCCIPIDAYAEPQPPPPASEQVALTVRGRRDNDASIGGSEQQLVVLRKCSSKHRCVDRIEIVTEAWGELDQRGTQRKPIPELTAKQGLVEEGYYTGSSWTEKQYAHTLDLYQLRTVRGKTKAMFCLWLLDGREHLARVYPNAPGKPCPSPAAWIAKHTRM